MPSYRFARSPRWILTHLLVLGLVVAMVGLGSWQLRRLDERRERNALVAQRAAAPAVPVGDVADPGDEPEATDALRFRRVTASGRYDGAATTVVRATQDGAPGGYVLTPLALGGGEEVVVLRGFGGTAPTGEIVSPPPPGGVVRVDGLAVPVERLDRPTRTAVQRLAADRPGLLDVVVEATATDPPEAPGALVPVPPPELGDGPHLSYAVQWFLFAAVGVAGYPFLLRRRARGG